MPSQPILNALAISGYRSFGEELQLIGPFGSINFLAGLNNSGKSNLLRFIDFHLDYLFSGSAKKDEFNPALDGHIGSQNGHILMGIGLPLKSSLLDRKLETLNGHNRTMLREIISEEIFTKDTECAWFFRSTATIGGNLTSTDDRTQSLIRLRPAGHWRTLWNAIYPTHHGGSEKDWIEGVLRFLSPFNESAPKVTTIPAVRRIGDPASTPVDFSGLGIIDRLAQLQNPSHHQQHLKDQFKQIIRFLRNVARNDTASLEIPYSRDVILVHMDGKTLPLASLGTGIHEVVIHAAAATILQNQIVCMEEPELHLHPVLQRKLIRYLHENTNNQYFISTHSAQLLDSTCGSIFHIRLDNGQTKVSKVTSAIQQWDVCRDLGYRASDLVQSNCIIWVEGPTDRVYLNHWLKSEDSDLIEGVHYSIMFYGGRLLCHLSANDDEVNDFIALRRINRNVAIVIDSDRSSANSQLNATKQRIVQEFDKAPGFAWVTAGREIENYIGNSLLKACVEKVRPNHGHLVKGGQYSRVLPHKNSACLVDKLKVSHEVANSPTVEFRYDLKSKLERLTEFIRQANE